MAMATSIGVRVWIVSSLVWFGACLSSPSSSSHAPGTFLFQRFSFAPNGVCVRPEVFHTSQRDDEVDGHDTFSMRNVPGEGDCMFMAVALAAATSMGLGGNNALLRAVAAETRAVVAQVLGGPGTLYIEHQRVVLASDLLRSASMAEGISTDEYLTRLIQRGEEGGLYGGGPELTVLSNVLRRPISIYELHHDAIESLDIAVEGGGVSSMKDDTLPKKCRMDRVGVFGDLFQDPCLTIPNSAVLSGLQPGAYSWHLHILVVDANSSEKHACVLLPNFCDAP
jgi:hypothetical protein